MLLQKYISQIFTIEFMSLLASNIKAIIWYKFKDYIGKTYFTIEHILVHNPKLITLNIVVFCSRRDIEN